jgi:hypothetical protein
LPTLAGQLRPAERGLLWALVHQPERVLPFIKTLEDVDFEGLSSGELLRMARELSDAEPGDVPNLLMERLSSVEANRLAAIASEPSAPVLDFEATVKSLKRLTFERELASVQREIDQLQARGGRGPELDALLLLKLELGRRLAPGKR